MKNALNVYILSCYLIQNPRMTSTYMVLAPNKNIAKRIMTNDGEHHVVTALTYNEYLIYEDWINLDDEQQFQFSKNTVQLDLNLQVPICIEAGT